MDARYIAESHYPLTYRKEFAEKLGEYLKRRQSVNLIGMRRVGISNFLRFFLYHKDIASIYIDKDQKHLFIAVDLADLVEREIYPFWTLTLKRIVDACEHSSLPDETKAKINSLFLTSIQSQDLFFVIDAVRQSLVKIVESGFAPTLFFLRFDRLQDAFNPSFFDNLEGLYDATHEQLAYVFTSYRSLDTLFPTAKTTLSIFAQKMFVPPAKIADMKIVYEAYQERYHLALSEDVEQALFRLVKGNIQYLQLALIILHEKREEAIVTTEQVQEALLTDERIILESEELWESLNGEEQRVLLLAAQKQSIKDEDKVVSSYLWDTGFLTEKNTLFSPLLEQYVLQKEPQISQNTEEIHLTRKEHLLFVLLESRFGEICEREDIIAKVWPEYQEFGVSDWAIDRLVARVRVKLREQNSPYEIITVRTRGYKLTKVKE